MVVEILQQFAPRVVVHELRFISYCGRGPPNEMEAAFAPLHLHCAGCAVAVLMVLAGEVRRSLQIRTKVLTKSDQTALLSPRKARSSRHARRSPDMTGSGFLNTLSEAPGLNSATPPHRSPPTPPGSPRSASVPGADPRFARHSPPKLRVLLLCYRLPS